jgi:hypothetical protein
MCESRARELSIKLPSKDAPGYNDIGLRDTSSVTSDFGGTY